MDTLTSGDTGGGPGQGQHCRTAAADSTSTSTNSTASSNGVTSGRGSGVVDAVNNYSGGGGVQAEQQVSSTTVTSATTATAPTTNINNNNNNNNNNNSNKLKPQQQQLQQQQQQQPHYQFRTPQQFVKHKKSTSTLQKKNKTWNKRQNKTGKQQQHFIGGTVVSCNIGHTLVSMGGGNGVGVGGGNGTGGTLPTVKADLENIQNFKNQIATGGSSGGGGGLHPHHHSGRHGGVGVGNPGGTATAGVGVVDNLRGIGGNGGGLGNNGLPAVALAGLEKLGYGHGHLKHQQLYKKMLMHRGHHHHVLCAGVAHNTLGSVGSGNGGSIACCKLNGCNGQNGKDVVGSAGVTSSNGVVNAVNALHFCCGRSKFFLPDKRPRKEIIIPPTKFLLGGNISDPLNLNSLQNETSNASANNTPATTPRQSPITTPPKVEVIIPPNIHDPLHLLDPVDSMEYEKQLTSPMKRCCAPQRNKSHHHHHRHRKYRKPKRRRHESHSSNTGSTPLTPLEPLESHHNTSAACHSTLLTDGNSTTQTAGALTSLSISLRESSVQQQQQNDSNTRLSVRVSEERDEKVLLLSPQHCIAPPVVTDSNATSSSTATMDMKQGMEQNVTAGNTLRSQHVAGVVAGAANELVSAAANIVGADGVQLPSTFVDSNNSEVLPRRERPSRDLRLELNNTTLMTMCSSSTAASSSSSTTMATITTTATLHASTCSSGANAVTGNGNSGGSGGVVVGGVGGVCGSGGGNRKRKISESNNSQKNKKFHRVDAMDKIVSPVVPQPGAWKRPPRLVPSGSRKSNTRRSTSLSESELLSPADEVVRPLQPDDGSRVETPDFNKMDSTSEMGMGSPLSTASGATSVTTAEHESLLLADTSAGENSCNMFVVGGGDGDSTTSTTVTTAPAATATKTTTDSTAAVSGAVVEGVKVQASTAVTASATSAIHKKPKFPADGGKYRYGNYDRYAGYRHLNEFMDVRLQVFQRHVELFQNKDILDVGSNVGHMTISVARNLAPKSILGIDIDKDLVARARRNLAMYVRILPETRPMPPKKPAASEGEKTVVKLDAKTRNRLKRRRRRSQRAKQAAAAAEHQQQQLHWHHHHWQWQQRQQDLNVPAQEFFPVCFPLSYGSIPNATYPGTGNSPPATSNTPAHAASCTPASHTVGSVKLKNNFPRNVFFRHTNYVLKDESQLCNDQQQYDLILCLSVTKWIHLNYGDAGLKLAFKRMFNQLRPGGKLILEAQNWASYKKKKNLTEDIYQNYCNIEFFPNKFHEYLLSTEVGFSHSYTLGVPRHLNKGFCRPIQLYAKGDYTPNHVRWSDAYYPQTPYEAYRGIYATMPPRPSGMAYPMSSTRSQAYDTPHYSGGASGPYSCRQTPMHQPTSQYYNPLETDSYQPSYDMEYLNHMYVFASPLYQTVWSPPASLRNSSSHTPVFGSVRDAELDGDGSSGGGGGGNGSYRQRHVYPPNDDTSSPNASAGGAFNSIRDPDTDDSNQLPAGQVQHVYATNCGESSSSPQVLHHHHDGGESINLEEGLLDEDGSCDLHEA